MELTPLGDNLILEITEKNQSVGKIIGISESVQKTGEFSLGDIVFTSEFGGIKFEYSGKLLLWVTKREILGKCQENLLVTHSSFMEQLENFFENQIRRSLDSELAVL
jgi:hypothetical protein